MSKYEIYTVYDDGEQEWELVEEAEKLFKEAKVRPSSREEILYVAVHKDKVVGAITLGSYYSQDKNANNYTFSVVVEPSFRAKGVATDLIKEVLESVKHDEENYYFEVWVINPLMVSILEKLGFETDGGWTPDNPHMYKY